MRSVPFPETIDHDYCGMLNPKKNATGIVSFFNFIPSKSLCLVKVDLAVNIRKLNSFGKQTFLYIYV